LDISFIVRRGVSMTYYLVPGLVAAVMGGVLFILLLATTTWHPYVGWLAAWSVTEFVLYGLDKGLARVQRLRVPELILNLLAGMGGFAGGWLGMLVFRHKSNLRRHPAIWAVLVLSTVAHAVLIYFLLIRRT
jgi:uncharacterized membrane protein YsdA (DUF1294 family)